MQLAVTARRRRVPLVLLLVAVGAMLGGVAVGQDGEDDTPPVRAVGHGIVYEVTDTAARLFPGPRFDTDGLVEPFDREGFRRATVSNSFRVRRGTVGAERPDRMRIVARANDRDIDPVMVGSGIVPMPRGIEAELSKNVRGQRVVGRKVRAVFRAKGGNYRVGTRVQVDTDVVLGTTPEALTGPASMLSLPSPGAGAATDTGLHHRSTPTGAPAGTKQVGAVTRRLESATLEPEDGGFGQSLRISQSVGDIEPLVDVDPRGGVSIVYRIDAREAGASGPQLVDLGFGAVTASFGIVTDGLFLPLDEEEAEFEDGVAKVVFSAIAAELLFGGDRLVIEADLTVEREVPNLRFSQLFLILFGELVGSRAAG